MRKRCNSRICFFPTIWRQRSIISFSWPCCQKKQFWSLPPCSRIHHEVEDAPCGEWIWTKTNLGWKWLVFSQISSLNNLPYIHTKVGISTRQIHAGLGTGHVSKSIMGPLSFLGSTRLKDLLNTSLDCGKVNFLYSSWYGAVVLGCDQNGVDNSGVFLLLMSSTYTDPKAALLPTPPERSWEGQMTPADQRNIPHEMVSCSACRAEERRKGRTFGVMEFVFPTHYFLMVRPCFPGWTAACPWEVLNEFPAFHCLHAQLFFTYWTLFISTHAFSYFYPSESLPHPSGWGLSGCMGLSWQLGLNHDTTYHVND